MAKAKKFVPDEAVASFFTQMKPETPIMTSAEKRYFKGLKKRGYSEAQIRQGIEKAGYKVGLDFFVVKAKTSKSAPAASRSQHAQAQTK